MPTYPRSHYVRPNEIATYHTWSRCVQRAFLCGQDPYTRMNYDHRRDWIEQLFKYQASVFAVDLCNYDILSNHEHLIIRTRPDISLRWSAEEVAWRWKMAWPSWDPDQGWSCQPSDEEIRRLLAEPDKMMVIRKNLASLSWFMARVKEPIAKLANREMERTGHFWEQRFQCRRLEDLPAELTCSVYVDINQVAAGLADSLGTSRCSAIRLRLREWRAQEVRSSIEEFHTDDRPDLKLDVSDMERLLDGSFLAPISDQGPLLLVGDLSFTDSLAVRNIAPASSITSAPQVVCYERQVDAPETADESDNVEQPTAEVHSNQRTVAAMEPGDAAERKERTAIRLSRDERAAAPATYQIHASQKARQRCRASDQPFLGIPAEQYRALVAWTAEQITVGDAQQPLPAHLSDLLQRAGIVTDHWLTLMRVFQTRFRVAVGTATSVNRFLKTTKRRQLHGIRLCRSAFT